jgi:hypothetical protein
LQTERATGLKKRRKVSGLGIARTYIQRL